jgi:hypothetical protein
MGLAKKSGPKIVVHIRRNLGGGKISLTESSSSRLEFKLSHIWLTGSVELRSDRCSGLVLFDQSCLMDHQKLLSRHRQKVESKIYGEQNYKGDESFGYKLFEYFEITLEASDIILLIFSSSL